MRSEYLLPILVGDRRLQVSRRTLAANLLIGRVNDQCAVHDGIRIGARQLELLF